MVSTEVGVTFDSSGSSGSQIEGRTRWSSRARRALPGERGRRGRSPSRGRRRHWFGLREGAGAPVESTEHAGGLLTERDEDLPHEPHSLDPIPILRALVRPYGVQKVITAHPYAAWDELHQLARERTLSRRRRIPTPRQRRECSVRSSARGSARQAPAIACNNPREPAVPHLAAFGTPPVGVS